MNLRRPARWALALVLLTGGVLLGAYLLRGALLYPHLKRTAITFFKEDLDLQLELGAIHGSLLGGIQFDDVNISSLTSTATPLNATIDALRLHYRLVDLFQGIDIFLGGMTVMLDRPHVHIDLSRPSSENPPADIQEASGNWPAVLPRIAVSEGALVIEGDGYGSRFSGIRIAPSIREGAVPGSAFQLGIAAWSWHLPPLRDGHVKAAARLVLDASGRLEISGLTLNGTEVVDEGTLDLSQLPQRLPFEVRMAPRSGRLVVSGQHDDDRLQLHVDGEGVDLALGERILEMPPQDVAGKITVTADLQLPYDRPEELHGTVDLRAGSGHWQSFIWEDIHLQAQADKGRLQVPGAEWLSQGNTGRIQDLSLSMAALFDGQLVRLLDDLNTRFDLSLENVPALTALWNVDTRQAAAAVPPHHLTLAGRVQSGVLRLAEGKLTCGDSVVNLNRLQADLAALAEGRRNAGLAVAADLDVPELGVFSTLLPTPPLAGRLQGTLELTGPWHALQGRFSLAGENLRLADLRLGDLDAAGRADGAWMSVERLALRNGHDRLSLAGRLHLASGRLEETRGTAQIQDIGAYVNPLLPSEWPAQGAIHLRSTVAGTLTQPDLWAAVTLTDAGLGDLSAKKIQGELEASLHQLTIRGVDIKADPGDFSLAGKIAFEKDDNRFTADLTRLSLQKDGAALELTAPARILALPNNGWRITPLVLDGSAGRIAARGRFGGTGPADLQVDMAGIQADPWLAVFGGPVRALEGLDARLRFSGTAATPRIDLSGTLRRLQVGQWPHPLQGRFDIALDEGGIALRQWNWSDGAAQQMSAEGRIPLVYRGDWQDSGAPMQLRADFTMDNLAILKDTLPDLPIAGGRLQARLDLDGTLAAPTGSLQSAFDDLMLSPSFEGQPQGPFAGTALLRVHGRGADLEALRIDSKLLSLHGAGHWRSDGAAAFRAMRSGRWPGGTVDGALDVDVPDLGWLAVMLPGVRRIAGRLNGAVKVEGPLRTPAVKADLRLEEGALQPEGDAPPLEAVQADLEADRNQVLLRSCRGEIGGAPFRATGAFQKTDGGKWATDLRFSGTNLLLYRTADIRVRADTELHLIGPVEKMALQGRVGLTNSRFRRNVDLFGFLKAAPPSAGTPSEELFSLPDPPLKDMTFDVAIDSKTPVEVVNNVARGGLRPHLHLGGTGELPLLTGEVYLEPTRLRLPAGIMTLQSGVIRYLPSRANRPVMDLQGEGKVFDYDITALIEGPLDEPQVTLSSSPPLAGDQLMLMLLTGRPPADRNSTESRGVPMNLAVYIGQDLLLQWFGGESTDSWTSILDRFDVTVGRRVTRAGDETLEAQFRLGEDVIRDGDRIYITGERDVFDFYNAGVKFVFRFK